MKPRGQNSAAMRMIRVKLDVLLFLLLGLPAPVQAQFTYTTNDGTITITGYIGSGGVVTIPSEIHGLPVTSLGNRAFAGCINLSNLTLPNTLRNIGAKAFWECTNLANLVIPKNVAYIGDFAFSRCLSLVSIEVETNNPAFASVDGVLFNKTRTTLIRYPEAKLGSYTVPQGVTKVWDDAFSVCRSLTGVTIPNTAVSIGETAFIGCDGLTSITIPDGVTSIGGAAFRGCNTLTNVTLGNTVTSIGQWAFDWCPELTTVAIPASVTNIGNFAFGGGAKLTAINTDALNRFYASEDGVLFNKDRTTLLQCPGAKTGPYVIPNGVTNIGESAFAYCENLTNVTIPNGVASIGYCAFEGCSGLTGVTIPDTLTSIGGFAFRGCSNLANVTIPSDLTSIGDLAFEGCSSLTNVIIPKPKPQPPAHPLVEGMLHDITPANLYTLMSQITGEEPVLVGNEAVIFTNRLTGSAPLRKATQFAFEQLEALGLQVEYQCWDWGRSYFDRNVIGIQPGVNRPEEIAAISEGGHLFGLGEGLEKIRDGSGGPAVARDDSSPVVRSPSV